MNNNHNHMDVPPLEDRSHSLDPVDQYLREINLIPRITQEEEIELAGRIKNGDEVAREKMISANLRLVVTIAKRYRDIGMPFLDLINEGNIGLMKAVRKFDPKKGAKLSTYSAIWIKQTIRLALANQSRDIRLPTHFIDKIARMKRVEVKLQQELDRCPTDEEVAEQLGVEVEKVKQMRFANAPPVQLDSPVGDDSDDRTFADLIPDERATDPREDSSAHSDSDYLNGLISKLSDQEQKILSLRFGFNDGGEGMTLDEIGEVYGVTRERIRQRQAEAFHRLRILMNGQCPHRKSIRKKKGHNGVLK